jgi:hypothetical protein
MPTPESLAEQFEEHRAHLQAVAYRMLGREERIDNTSLLLQVAIRVRDALLNAPARRQTV